MKKITLLVLTLFSFTFAFSQSNLKGRVIDSNGFPLPGATLIVDGDKGAVSDFNGFYRFVNLDSGSVEIKVSYIGFEGATASVELTDNSTTTKDFTLEPSATELAEIIVSGYSSGIIKGLNQQKADLNVTNIISADQVGKFPDDNVGDVLKRVAGVSMQGDQGEARNIVIRGFASALNSVTLNGDRIPSAEGDNRNVQLDLIPSAMIQTIEVNKSMTPDMEGDAIGGSVNLVTRSNPSSFRASATLSAGDEPIRSDGSNSNFAFVMADKMNDKLSYSFSTSIQTKSYGSDNIEFEWNDPDDWAEEGAIGEHDIRRYDVKRTRRSVGLNLDYEINDNNSLFVKTIYNHRDDWENRFRVRIANIDDWTADPSEGVRVRKQTKGGIGDDINDNRRLEDQRVSKISFGGDHLA
jgi:TonB-dependent receptor